MPAGRTYWLMAAAVLAAFTTTSCSWLGPRRADDRTTRLEMRLVETPEDRDERGYVWIDTKTGKVLESSDPKNPPGTVIDVSGQTEIERKWRVAIAASLQRRGSYEFVDTPFDDVIAFLRSVHGRSFVVDARVLDDVDGEITVTFKADNVTLKEALGTICGDLGLAYALENGAVFISTKEKIEAAYPSRMKFYWKRGPTSTLYMRHGPSQADNLSGALTTVVDVDFVNADRRRALEFFRDTFRFELVIDRTERPIPAGRLRALRLKHVTFEHALSQVCERLGLGYTVRDGALIVAHADVTRARAVAEKLLRDPETEKRMQKALETRVSFDFVTTPLDDLIAFYRSQSGLNIIVDPHLAENEREQDLTLQLDGVKTRDAMAWSLRLLNLDMLATDGAIFITTKAKKREAVRHGPTGLVLLDEKEWEPLAKRLSQPVSFCFPAMPPDDAFAFLATTAGVDIVVDPAARKLPSYKALNDLQAEDMKLKYALVWVCRELGLAYTVRRGEIHIATPDRLWRFERGRRPRMPAKSKAPRE